MPGKRGQLTAHDMRHLCQCVYCRKLADDRETVCVNKEHYHGACAHAVFGLKGILSLPRSQREKFRICDMPRDDFRELLNLTN